MSVPFGTRSGRVGLRPASAALSVALAVLIAAVGPAGAASHHSTPITLTPDGSEVWVVNPDHGTVGVIPTSGGLVHTLQHEIAVGAEPWCIDVHPGNGEAWVISMAENRIYVIDTDTYSVITTIDDLGFETYGVAFNPSGSTALVTATGSDEVFAVDVATRAITQTFDVYRRPRGIAWKADGTRAWVSHLLMPEFFGRLTTVFPATWTTAEIFLQQVFHPDNGGYPSTMQGITLAPPPHDDYLWIPNNMINTTTGGLVLNPLTPTNIMHAVVFPVNVTTSSGSSAGTYHMSQGGTPVGGPIAVDFAGNRGYVANLHSNNVTVLGANLVGNPTEIAVIPAGDAPYGVVAHPTLPYVYVANWLSRDVTVMGNGSLSVVTTVPSASGEVLPPQVLNGKKVFFTSNGPMAQDDVGSCASCHVFGTMDARPWDLSQFGKHIRATPDIRGIGFTGAHDWTADKDEMEDHEFGILEFTGGAGLTGGPNPPLGAPNAGLSQDLDDLGLFMATLEHRPTTPFRNPDGSLTADALAGQAIFEDPVVGCASCHSGPFFTDSSLQQPFLKHDVGTADPADTDAAAGFDTPSLVGLWDTGPYLHHALAPTLLAVLTTWNPDDLHGTTSQLTAQELDQLVAFLRQIAWPSSPGSPVDAPVATAGGTLDRAFPNPFADGTSLRFTVENPATRVSITIFDVTGRRVRTLLDAPMARGTHTAGWDARDERGRPVTPGTYFARIAVDGEDHGGKKLTVIR
jgi:YVTN family beta-propeller protein